jgi:hypothetical protein
VDYRCSADSIGSSVVGIGQGWQAVFMDRISSADVDYFCLLSLLVKST